MIPDFGFMSQWSFVASILSPLGTTEVEVVGKCREGFSLKPLLSVLRLL